MEAASLASEAEPECPAVRAPPAPTGIVVPLPPERTPPPLCNPGLPPLAGVPPPAELPPLLLIILFYFSSKILLTYFGVPFCIDRKWRKKNFTIKENVYPCTSLTSDHHTNNYMGHGSKGLFKEVGFHDPPRTR
ncbi:hypothetical protein OIU85_000042 [Salix viminalis]|uniref:Uncharacterized protein n=1 Tax=Salix viminalis TaxID=40686 RepID=A0A9Q0VIM3_SALVM|nr:hypothetical protein OIU85_000042 [Salix viminalis]